MARLFNHVNRVFSADSRQAMETGLPVSLKRAALCLAPLVGFHGAGTHLPAYLLKVAVLHKLIQTGVVSLRTILR